VKSQAEIEASERERCCRDVCMYCSGNAPGYMPAIGPNEAGNYTHTPRQPARGLPGQVVLCAGSAIRSRSRWIDSGQQLWTEETV
jgi:hypothetical protein